MLEISRKTPINWLFPALVLTLGALDRLWVTEDAYITFQSVENLWRGYGPNFNRGIRVESFSHPLWFIILAGARVFGEATLPYLAAILGVVATVTGLVLSVIAATRRFGSGLPIGALVIAFLPPFWDFASSGLEGGITFLWIGAASFLLSKEIKSTSSVAAMIGLGPIIRPDLSVMAALFMVPLLLAIAKRGLLALVTAIVAFIVPGAAWQIFRMGYYAALIPNTYIAKEGLSSRWDQGLIYLNDLFLTYHLQPIVVFATALLWRSLNDTKNIGSNTLKTTNILVIAAVLHGFLVCRAGGDFMHARLLLPALFALLSACAVVPYPSANTRARRACLAIVLIWCVLVALFCRPPYGANINEFGIADERQWYVRSARAARPVSLEDYSFHPFSRTGDEVSRMIEGSGIRAIYWANIGITAAMIPDHIVVIDPLGLNDHIGSRIKLETRGRPGHEKIASPAWFLARYPAGVGMVIRNQLGGAFTKAVAREEIEQARRVLDSPELRELDHAVTAPLTVELFVKNILNSWRYTFIRIPS